MCVGHQQEPSRQNRSSALSTFHKSISARWLSVSRIRDQIFKHHRSDINRLSKCLILITICRVLRSKWVRRNTLDEKQPYSADWVAGSIGECNSTCFTPKLMMNFRKLNVLRVGSFTIFHFQDFNTAVPMKAVLLTADQLRLAHSAHVLHIDAAGGIIRKTTYIRKDVYLFSIVPDSKEKTTECVSASDDVGCTHWQERLKDHSLWPALGHHSLCGAHFCGSFTDGNLTNSFHQMSRRTQSNNSIIFLCSSHIMGRLAKTIPGSDTEMKRLTLACFSAILTGATLDDARKMCGI